MSCYIIILNYNGWKDTVECLDSIFQTTNIDYKVIVCDNNSKDNSVLYIRSWLDGNLKLTDINPTPFLKQHLNERPPYIYWDREKDIQYNSPLLLVETGDNRGFAAGNNVGIRIALRQIDCDYLFILNNDTVVTRTTIYEGVTKLQEEVNAGICSTNVKYYDNPNQSAWKLAYFNPDTGNEKIVTKGHISLPKYLYKYTGMAFFITRKFIETIGLMNEKYFLYFEELDWTIRSRKKFKILMANRSIVYHKEGATASYQSPLSRFCMLRSRFLFIEEYYPKKIKKIYFLWWLRSIKRFLEGDFAFAFQILKFLIIFPVQKEKYTGGYFEYHQKDKLYEK